MPVNLKRTLVFFLALRAILAPFTYRPTKPAPVPRYSLVMRARWWPPQRFLRFSATSKLLQLYQGKNRLNPERSGRVVRLPALWPPCRCLCPIAVPCESAGSSIAQATMVLRC